MDHIYASIDLAIERLLEYVWEQQLHLKEDDRKQFTKQYRDMCECLSDDDDDDMEICDIEWKYKRIRALQHHQAFRAFNPLKFIANELRKLQ